MKCAKFHLIGEDSDWYKLRVQKEIESQGLSGSVLDAGEGKLAVVVEGSEDGINRLYTALKEASPKTVLFTLIEYGKPVKEKLTKEDERWEEVIGLLKEIERTMRRINRKLDATPSEEKTETEVEQERGEEGKSEEAASAFAFMFG
jgi:acylphosphatase